MPHKLIECDDLTACPHSPDTFDKYLRLPHEAWLPVLQHPCDFAAHIFEKVSLNLLKNPNFNSSLLFRADVLYDSNNNELLDDLLLESQRLQALEQYNLHDGEIPGFIVERTILRRMIPRNPQLDNPILQTCLFLKSPSKNPEQTLVVYIPHSPTVDGLPWYHPRLQSLAYLHTWHPDSPSSDRQGTISLHYRLYPPETFPLSPRLRRTGQHLLSTIHRHGQGQLAGYTKRVAHDQLVSQQRVQDTYTELKKRHAQRLCDNWVEQTEPRKHVFEDLGIAAFLIELWRDMYNDGKTSSSGTNGSERGGRQSFPGFVDIGCGNGVLVDVLIREGYHGWGFDARRRKTWDKLDPSIQKHLKQMILVPQPLGNQSPNPNSKPLIHKSSNGLCRKRSLSTALKRTKIEDLSYHDGIFPLGTFIISNHADELTPWTPLLASISAAPFLCIPCCSHNLSGQRFRAPSVFNSNSADGLAPSYFAGQVNKAKSIPLVTVSSDNSEVFGPGNGTEQGDLKDLSTKSRSKQPSAYSSLCDWVAQLAVMVGYEVEREMLRLPSTRNVGIVGRTWRAGFEEEALEERTSRIAEIVREEKADEGMWIERAKGLVQGHGGQQKLRGGKDTSRFAIFSDFVTYISPAASPLDDPAGGSNSTLKRAPSS
ncbi:MAG: hypothetical protein Q9217_000841 [Psora testacea]